LFLTSNRGDDIDEAFLSRVTIPIFYENLDSAQRYNIWSKLLETNNINLSEKDRREIAEISLNGRQIKNIAKLAIWMSASKNKPLSASDILKTAKVQLDFREKLGRI
jgi:SpoVK/Ycf46/Vps4 family AAA+-type ATPase